MNGLSRVWNRLPPKARALFTLAALLACGAVCLLGEGLYFRARSTRVEGTVVDHDRRGRPVVVYQWAGQDWRHEESGPSESLAVGATIGVYVPPEGPPAARLDWAIGLLFQPGWACLMPATFFAAYGVVVSIRHRGGLAELAAAWARRNRSDSNGPSIAAAP
jgi:hypothetical protein